MIQSSNCRILPVDRQLAYLLGTIGNASSQLLTPGQNDTADYTEYGDVGIEFAGICFRVFRVVRG